MIDDPFLVANWNFLSLFCEAKRQNLAFIHFLFNFILFGIIILKE